VMALGVVFLNLTIGHLEARRGFILAQACVGMFTLLVSRGAGLPWFAAGYFMLGGFRTVRALATAQTRDLVDPGRMGIAYGLVETVAALALVLASPIAGFLYKLEPHLMYTASLGLILTSLTVGLLRIRRSKNHLPGSSKLPGS
jgi:hypothetical protein